MYCDEEEGLLLVCVSLALGRSQISRAPLYAGDHSYCTETSSEEAECLTQCPLAGHLCLSGSNMCVGVASFVAGAHAQRHVLSLIRESELQPQAKQFLLQHPSF